MNDDSREWATQGRRSWWSKHRSRVVVAALALALALGAWFAYENLDGFKALGRRDALGPSSESWFSSFPEEHGLVGADLIDGATRIRKELPSRVAGGTSSVDPLDDRSASGDLSSTPWL